MNDELEKLLAEATPRPWGYDTLVFVDGQALLSHTDRLGVLTIPDAALIVAAVNALPELVALRKASKALIDFCDGPFEAKRPDVFELRVRALRAALNQEPGQ